MDTEKIKKQSTEIYEHLRSLSNAYSGTAISCVEATGKIMQAQIIADIVLEMNKK